MGPDKPKYWQFNCSTKTRTCTWMHLYKNYFVLSIFPREPQERMLCTRTRTLWHVAVLSYAADKDVCCLLCGCELAFFGCEVSLKAYLSRWITAAAETKCYINHCLFQQEKGNFDPPHSSEISQPIVFKLKCEKYSYFRTEETFYAPNFVKISLY